MQRRDTYGPRVVAAAVALRRDCDANTGRADMDLIRLLVWLVIAVGFTGLVYATSRMLWSAERTLLAWAAFGVITIVAAQSLPVAVGFFPELLDTKPLRFWVDDGLGWVVRNWGRGFEAAAYPLLFLLLRIEQTLLGIPWWFMVIIFSGLAYLATRRPSLPLLVALGLVSIGLLDLWEDAVRTMALMVAATVTAIIVSIPVGTSMARSLGFRRIMTPILDLMQTLPSFVYLIPVVMIFGPGKVPALIATIVYAAPPLVRLTDLGIRQVAPEVMEATHAFGASPRQRLLGVQIPLALPTILAGVNQTTMMALAMVVIASMIGAGGLGYQVLQGIGRLEISRGLFAGLGIVVLAIIFDRITQAFGRQLQVRIGLAETRS
jgi:glycine betaine/proline transport system permease protein